MNSDLLTKRNISLVFVAAVVAVVCTALIFSVLNNNGSDDQDIISDSATLDNAEINSLDDLQDVEVIIEGMDFEYIETGAYAAFEDATF